MHFTGGMRLSHFSTNISRYGWMVAKPDTIPFGGRQRPRVIQKTASGTRAP